ncbi:MAG: cytochrome P450 [Vicinamibacterales bacterium]
MNQGIASKEGVVPNPPVYEPLGLDTIENPEPIYDYLLAEHPVHWHAQMQCWVVARYEDCRYVLTNSDLYARDFRLAGEDVPDDKQSVQSMDPPEQTALRNFLMSAIKLQPITEICRQGCDIIRHRLEELEPSGEFEFQKEIAAPYGMFVVSKLLGIREPNLDEFAAVSEAIARRMDAGLDPSTAAPGDSARRRLYELVDDWLSQPGSDQGLLAMVQGRSDSLGYPRHVIRNTIGIIVNAGYSTTFATTGNATLALLRNPDALEKLRDRSVLPLAVEEIVRVAGPAQGTSRVTTRDTELSGVPIKRGEVVLTLFAAANRDPRQFDRPAEMILDRSPNRHLGFGWGPHACLGGFVGQQALAEYLSCLANLPRAIELAGTPRRRRTATLRCLEYLPVRLRN